MANEGTDYINEFIGLYNAHEGAKKLAASFGPESTAEQRTEAKMSILKELGLPDNTENAESFYDAHVTGVQRAAKQTLEGYFGENRSTIVDLLPSGGLEKMVLAIDPVEFPENRRNSRQHNTLAKAHKEYAGIAKTNASFAKGETPFMEYSTKMSKAAKEMVTSQLSQNKYLDKKTISYFAFARAQLIGASPAAALAVGRKLEGDAMEKFAKVADEFASDEERPYTLVDYARDNIMYNTNVGKSIDQSYQVIAAAQDKKK